MTTRHVVDRPGERRRPERELGVSGSTTPATSDESMPVVLVTVGTDHHVFERLMGWLETWLRDHPDTVRMIVQHGFSRLPSGADGFVMCSRDELLELMRQSDIVIAQGGPGGIMDSRECGIMPIVVPRVAALDEVVDDHQLSFTRHLATAALVVPAFTADELRARLDAAVADPSRMRIEVESTHVEEAIAKFDTLVDELVRRKPARSRRRHPTP